MPLQLVLDDPSRPGAVVLHELTDDGRPLTRAAVPADGLAAAVAERERDRPRWVWDDTSRRYPPLLDAGVRVERCHDLRLCHAILRHSAYAAGTPVAVGPRTAWDGPRPGAPQPVEASLFDVDDAPSPGAADRQDHRLDPAAELTRQLASVAASTHPGRLRLLLAAESTGALIAEEMRHDGLPWSAPTHDEILTRMLGPRPLAGARPARLEALAGEIRTALDQPALNPDSQPDLLRGLRLAGFDLTSTSKWEIQGLDHPVREPLLEYKKLSRLLSANGWTWIDTWVHDGRFRPEYVPAGVVSGRWATNGGGALQLPAAIRAAVRADPGWRLVVADAAQLEPRVLAAMSGDLAMAAAARRADLYQGVVEAGIVQSRKDAKYAMLGAIYGATTGASAALMPQLTRAYPRAVGLVEEAARAGERGEVVTTWLGRSSPAPDAEWQDALHAAAGEGAGAEEVRAARRRGRDWGRFTRNFVVQGTAAEWALCWMAALRRRLLVIEAGPSAVAVGAAGGSADGQPAGRTGRGPHLVFFLHDEVVVHTPADVAEQAAEAVRESAAEAGRLLFGGFPVEFSLDVSVVDSYDQAD